MKSHAPAAPLPLRARKFITSLGTLSSLEPAIESLHELVRTPAEASRGRRLALVLGCCFPLLFVALVGLVEMLVLARLERKDPEFESMWKHLVALENVKSLTAEEWKAVAPVEQRGMITESLECYIAYRFGKIIKDPNSMSSHYAATFLDDDPGLRVLADQVVADHPHVSEAEFRAAEKTIEPLRDELAAQHPRLYALWIPVATFLIFGWLILIAIFSLAAALICRGGLLLWALGLAVVRTDGVPASRPRVCWRTAIAWSPVVLISVVAAYALTAISLLTTWGGVPLSHRDWSDGGRRVFGTLHLVLPAARPRHPRSAGRHLARPAVKARR